jgi:hypothetical protein
MSNAWFESVAEAQRRAKKRLPPSVYGALIAGAEQGLTVSDNVGAFSDARCGRSLAAPHPNRTGQAPAGSGTAAAAMPCGGRGLNVAVAIAGATVVIGVLVTAVALRDGIGWRGRRSGRRRGRRRWR